MKEFLSRYRAKKYFQSSGDLDFRLQSLWWQDDGIYILQRKVLNFTDRCVVCLYNIYLDILEDKYCCVVPYFVTGGNMIHEVSALPLVDAADDLVDVVHAELGEELLWHLVHLNVLAELDCLAVVVVVVVYSITANAPISYWPTSWRFVEQ